MRSFSPVFLSLEQATVGNDLEFKSEFGIDDLLEFLEHCLHFGLQLNALVLQLAVLPLQLAFALLLLSPQLIQLASDLRILENMTEIPVFSLLIWKN